MDWLWYEKAACLIGPALDNESCLAALASCSAVGLCNQEFCVTLNPEKGLLLWPSQVVRHLGVSLAGSPFALSVAAIATSADCRSVSSFRIALGYPMHSLRIV